MIQKLYFQYAKTGKGKNKRVDPEIMNKMPISSTCVMKDYYQQHIRILHPSLQAGLDQAGMSFNLNTALQNSILEYVSILAATSTDISEYALACANITVQDGSEPIKYADILRRIQDYGLADLLGPSPQHSKEISDALNILSNRPCDYLVILEQLKPCEARALASYGIGNMLSNITVIMKSGKYTPIFLKAANNYLLVQFNIIYDWLSGTQHQKDFERFCIPILKEINRLMKECENEC